MKRPKITDPECKRLTMSDIPIVKYSKLQDKYIDYLEAQAKQLILSGVMQALPKRLSNAAYIQATHKGYEEFMIWWDKQVQVMLPNCRVYDQQRELTKNLIKKQ